MNISDASEYSDQLRELRQDLDGMIAVGLAKCKAGNGRYMSLTRTHLQAARAWMGKTLGALPGNPSPYQVGQAGGLQPHNTFVPPTADVNEEDEALLESQLFLDEETLGVQRVKRLRTHLTHVCASVHGLRQNLDPLAFGENGLSPYETLSTLLIHLHQASIWLGYELSDMADDKRGGATTEQEPKKTNASTTTGSSVTPLPEPTTETTSPTDSASNLTLTETAPKESQLESTENPSTSGLANPTPASNELPADEFLNLLPETGNKATPSTESAKNSGTPRSKSGESSPALTPKNTPASFIPEPEVPTATKSRKRK